MRAPYNVLVLPYFLGKERPLFCILKRSDLNIWQFIAGGGEDDEPPLTAARRESGGSGNIDGEGVQETGIHVLCPSQQLF